MTREEWLKAEVRRIKNGGTIRQRCAMATEDRIALSLCKGDLPEARAHRGSETCSAECQADRRRLRRWENAKNKCRYCGVPVRKKVPVTGKAEWEELPSDQAIHELLN